MSVGIKVAALVSSVLCVAIIALLARDGAEYGAERLPTSTNVLMASTGVARSFFHFSDVHIEPFYYSGDETDKELKDAHKTCRVNNVADHTLANMFVQADPANRYFGRYHCDPPMSLLTCTLGGMVSLNKDPIALFISGTSSPGSLPRQMLVLNEPDASYGVYSIGLVGDLAGHVIARENIQQATQNRVLEKIRESFPNKQMVLAIGNNDPWPRNSMSPTVLQTLWYKLYQFYLPSSIKTDFLKGGYYSVDVDNSKITGETRLSLFLVKST